MNGNINLELLEQRAKLHGSFLLFCKTFFPVVTAKEFYIPTPGGRESHCITIARELTKVARGEVLNLVINVPPGHFKSTLLSLWTAWTLALYPDSQFIYVSYGKSLAAKHTEFIKRIITTTLYQSVFRVEIKQDSRAKDAFQTNFGGSIKAFGAGGAITGQDAGLPNQDRFTGALIMDDCHKPDEVYSETIRKGVIDNYRETILQRPRGRNVPMIYIGQRLHEDDLPAYLLSGKDERSWTPCILQALDLAGNALYPDLNTKEDLLLKQRLNPYVFASQFQQDPIPAGGSLFTEKDFVILDEEPEMLSTFITADTAETDKDYNDATALGFWGLYQIKQRGLPTDLIGLHCIDMLETRVEPRDLENTFMSFYGDCLLHKVKPKFAAIEQKSTGVTLCSVLSAMQGLKIIEVKRTKASGSKTARYLEMQPLLASKCVSFTEDARHVRLCIDHMLKITANNSHRHDDVCHSAGSKIATTKGYVNVENIRVGDKVITPLGIGVVSACGSTGYHRVINKFGLETTPDHKVLYGNKFIPLKVATDMIMLDKLSLIGLWKWRQRQLLYLMERNLDCRHRDDISKLLEGNTETNFFIALYGNFIQKKKYQTGILFTIKTIINLIIVLKIWSVFHISNIVPYISKEKNPMHIVKKLWRKCGGLLKNITRAKREGGRLEKGLKVYFLNLKNSFVKFAQQNLFPLLEVERNCVALNASDLQTTNTACRWDILSQSVSLAATNSPQELDHVPSNKAKHVQENVQDYGDIKEVFSLKVETYGVYYANNILVSNCDNFYDAIKIGLIDKNPMLLVNHLNKTSQTRVRNIAASVMERSRAKQQSWGTGQ